MEGPIYRLTKYAGIDNDIELMRNLGREFEISATAANGEAQDLIIGWESARQIAATSNVDSPTLRQAWAMGRESIREWVANPANVETMYLPTI